MYILGEQIYFWDLKKLVLDLRVKKLSDRAQLYYLYLIIFSSPIISLISNLDELWGIEWYFAFSWVAKFCMALGLFVCYWGYKTGNKLKRNMPNSFLSCLIAISWVMGFRFFLLFFTGFWLLVLLNNFNLQFLNPDYLLWYLNLWTNSPYDLIFGIIILNSIFFGLVYRAITKI